MNNKIPQKHIVSNDLPTHGQMPEEAFQSLLSKIRVLDAEREQTEQELVLCQDCLAVSDYSADKHQGLIKCACGGDFCGCKSCNAQALDINQKQLAETLTVALPMPEQDGQSNNHYSRCEQCAHNQDSLFSVLPLCNPDDDGCYFLDIPADDFIDAGITSDDFLPTQAERDDRVWG